MEIYEKLFLGKWWGIYYKMRVSLKAYGHVDSVRNRILLVDLYITKKTI